MKHYIITRFTITRELQDFTEARTLRTGSEKKLAAFIDKLNHNKRTRFFSVESSYAETQKDLNSLIQRYLFLKKNEGNRELNNALHRTIICLMWRIYGVPAEQGVSMLELKTYLTQEA